MTTTCAQTNASVRHFARTVGDILPCGHAAVRAADSSLECGARIRCGHCKGRHETVALVARCAADEAEARWEAQQEAAEARFWEEGTHLQAMRYRDEVEADERRAFPF